MEIHTGSLEQKERATTKEGPSISQTRFGQVSILCYCLVISPEHMVNNLLLICNEQNERWCNRPVRGNK